MTAGQKQLTEGGKQLDSSDNVRGEVHVDGDVGSVEDGDGVEDDGVDSAPLLEDHDYQAKDERMPDLLGPKGGEEWGWWAGIIGFLLKGGIMICVSRLSVAVNSKSLPSTTTQAFVVDNSELSATMTVHKKIKETPLAV